MPTKQEMDAIGIRETVGDILHQAKVDKKPVSYDEARRQAEAIAKEHDRRREGR